METPRKGNAESNVSESLIVANFKSPNKGTPLTARTDATSQDASACKVGENDEDDDEEDSIPSPASHSSSSFSLTSLLFGTGSSSRSVANSSENAEPKSPKAKWSMEYTADSPANEVRKQSDEDDTDFIPSPTRSPTASPMRTFFSLFAKLFGSSDEDAQTVSNTVSTAINHRSAYPYVNSPGEPIDASLPTQHVVRDMKCRLSAEKGSIVKPEDLDPALAVKRATKDEQGRFVAPKNDFEILLERLTERDATLEVVSLPQSQFLSTIPDAVRKLASAMYSNLIVTEVDLKMNRLRDTDMIILCPSFSSCLNLRNLNLETNYISSAGIEIISDMMETHPSLSVLRIANQVDVVINVEAERALVNALSHNIRITTLGYAFERAGTVRERELIDRYLLRNQGATKRNVAVEIPAEYPFPAVKNRQPVAEEQSIEEEEVDTSELTVRQRIELLARQRGNLIISDDLDPNKKASLRLDSDGKVVIPESDFQKLLRQLQENDPTLTSISFRNNNMRSSLCSNEEPLYDNFSRFSAALLFNSHVTDIDLYYVNMRDPNLIDLCAALSTCGNLRTLNLGTNKLSTVGIIALANMLETHKSLRVIKLEDQRGVCIGPEAEKHLVNALSQNLIITNLAYSFNDVTAKYYAEQFLGRNGSPQHIASSLPKYPYPEVVKRTPK